MPLVEDFERQGFGDSKTVDGLREQISIARGEPQPPIEYDEDLESSPKLPDELIDGTRYAYRLQRMGWGYDQVSAVLDELETRPVSAQHEGLIMRDRLVLTSIYQLPDDDIARQIERALQVLADEPVKDRAPTILIACMDRVALIERYVPPLIAELEDALRRDPGDSEVARNLESLRRSLERARNRG
jgi:hypothetical protein